MGSTDHPALSQFSWIYGVWEAVEAEVSFPTIKTLNFKEILEFHPTTDPALRYKSDTWRLDTDALLHCETGFLRINPETEKLTLLLAHHLGLIEISEGTMEEQTITLESVMIPQMPGFCLGNCEKLIRKWYMEGENLCSTVLMATDKTPLHLHLQCKYKRKE